MVVATREAESDHFFLQNMGGVELEGEQRNEKEDGNRLKDQRKVF